MSPTAQTRTRLAVDARREQLLQAGVDLLKTSTPDDISIDAVARHAGISRGLLYHYFEDKDAFVVAILEQAGERLRVALEPDPRLSGRAQTAASIDAFITFAEDHAAGFRAVLTGGITNRRISAVVDETRERDLGRFVEAIASSSGEPLEASDRDVLRLALHAHMHFMEGAVVRWLSERQVTREQLRDLIHRSLDGTIAAAKAVARNA